jgi:GTP-binding protein
MKINSAEFVIGAMSLRQLPGDPLPEIALVGRSNVGKSSLVNTLLQRKNLARTSNTPGKTRQMNYYLINEQFYFVDLPGYGYAKVSKAEQVKWGQLIEDYLLKRPQLKGVIQLIDSRHEPSDADISMYQWLANLKAPVVVVITKADKISRGSWSKSETLVRKTLGMGPNVPHVLFSAESKLGREDLWKIIQEMTGLGGSDA